MVRIPLDYYRILGLPIQATAEQLQQAHRDRSLQLPPRREFSEAAVAARRELINEAYAVLSDPAQRQEYDAGFLAKSYELLEVPRGESSDDRERNGSYGAGDPDLGIDFYTPSIEIHESQFVGVLLILLELGEYELVLKLGHPYLRNGSPHLARDFGDPDLAGADILLAVALACLELGREQWNQSQFENAAESLELGRELLLKAGVFSPLRGEMQAELYKLRPYRILELLALPESHMPERRQGLTLLQEMLHDRGGIDGNGDDQSGLNTDHFLRFIQQLRSYLTSEEQQSLFEVEASRPSPVATYLAVYALVARGFAEGQPALIRRAKMLLSRLRPRQDVYLEQAVCALLLGQTEEASYALEQSQEYDSLAFIRDHSEGSPDLLPGLCLYSERWLQNEVFPYFRDLARRQASLKDYFADQDVQAYLEELPGDPEVSQLGSSSQPGSPYRASQPPFGGPRTGSSSWDRSSPGNSMATLPNPSNRSPGFASAERVSPRGEAAQESRSNGFSASGRNSRPAETRSPAPFSDYASGETTATRIRGSEPGDLIVPAAPSRRSTQRKGLRLDRLLFVAAIALLGLTAVAFAMSRLWGGSNNPAPAPAESPAATSPSPAQPASPAPTASPIAAQPLNETTAAAVIQSWLTAKTAAMGNQHQTSALSDILADPLLSEWQRRSAKAKAENWYWQYEHPNIEIVSVNTSSTAAGDTSPGSGSTDNAAASPSPTAASPEASPTTASSPESSPESSPAESSVEPAGSAGEADRAEVEAIVTEKGDLFVNGQLDQSSSYEDSIRARYSLVNRGGQWRIEAIDVLQ